MFIFLSLSFFFGNILFVSVTQIPALGPPLREIYAFGSAVIDAMRVIWKADNTLTSQGYGRKTLPFMSIGSGSIPAYHGSALEKEDG